MFREALPDARHLLEDIFKGVNAVAELILMPCIAPLIMLSPIVPPLLF